MSEARILTPAQLALIRLAQMDSGELTHAEARRQAYDRHIAALAKLRDEQRVESNKLAEQHWQEQQDQVNGVLSVLALIDEKYAAADPSVRPVHQKGEQQ